MPDFSLVPQMPLNGYNQDHKGIHVSELAGHALVSVAAPMNNLQPLLKCVESNYGCFLPEIGQTVLSVLDNARILRLQKDQFFLLFSYDGDRAESYVKERLKDTAYLCDQSDSWAMLRITGEGTRSALERICMLDLHASVFKVNTVARTVMEHLAVIIVHESKNQYLLLSPRSSARSFLHMVITSIENTS